MSVLEVITLPNDLLHQASETITDFDASLRKFAQDMIETMYEYRGVGLAAVQVASLKRILVIDVSQMRTHDREGNELSEEDFEQMEPQPEVYINPEILESSGSTEYEEGCLSIPGVYGLVKRPAVIKLKFHDLDGKEHTIEADGMRAIVLQHEIDHLNGVLFTDHLSPFKRSMTLQKYNKLRLQRLKEDNG